MKRVLLIIAIALLVSGCNSENVKNTENSNCTIIFKEVDGIYSSDILGNADKISIPNEGKYKGIKRYAFIVGKGNGILYYKNNNNYLYINGNKYVIENEFVDGMLSIDRSKLVYTDTNNGDSRTYIYDLIDGSASLVDKKGSNLYVYDMSDDASVILLHDEIIISYTQNDDVRYFGNLYVYDENELVLKDENVKIDGCGRNAISNNGSRYIYAKDWDPETLECKLTLCEKGTEDVVITNKLDVVNAGVRGQGYEISKDGSLVGALELEESKRNLLLYYIDDNETISIPNVISFYISDNNIIYYLEDTNDENSYDLYKIDENREKSKLTDNIGRIGAISPDGEIVVVYRNLTPVVNKPNDSEDKHSDDGIYKADETIYYGDIYWISEENTLNFIDSNIWCGVYAVGDSGVSSWLTMSNDIVAYKKESALYAMEFGSEKVKIYEGEIGDFFIEAD